MEADVERRCLAGLGGKLRSWFEQQSGVTASVEHHRSILSIFSTTPAVQLAGRKNILKIPYGMNLEMHVVGEKSPRKVDWAMITEINISKPPADWAKNI